MVEIIIKPSDDIPECDHMPVSATNTMRFVGHAKKDSETIYLWECKICGECVEKAHYRYTQSECPKHMWEFLGWEFHDNPDKYELNQIYSCFMCGKPHKESYTVRDRGMKGGVPDGIEHPEVKRALFLTESVHKREFKE